MTRPSRPAREFALPVRTLVFTSTCAVLGMPLLAACTDNTQTGSAGAAASNPRALTVQSTDSECKLSAGSAPSGTLTFAVTNGGSKVTEFYLYGEDGLRIIGEVENIGPGITRELVLRVTPGNYITACKPGMAGQGIRAPFAVSDSGEEQQGSSGNDVELVEQANQNYQRYVEDQTEQLVGLTAQFVALYKAGKDDEARALYPVARMPWERIETVAESFGDLDPKLDLREADLEPGQKWTGWHRIEKDLWPARAKNYKPLSKAERVAYSDDLVKNTAILSERVPELEFAADQIANGSRGLLDEVATGKITGEEEYWSRTDLWDFQANLEGARVAFEGLRPLLKERDPDLDSQIAAKFAAVQTLLDAQREGEGFKTYDKLSKAEIKELSDAVNALSEPLSKLAAAVV